VGFEGVGDEGLFGVELQADFCQPFRCHGFEMVEGVKVVVKYHEVVGVADDAGRRFSGRSLTQDGFEAVEGDVGEEG
jgi:hypothetical protein